jgi:predicted Na+-dependent transporter
MEIPLLAMVRLLALIVFIPMGAREISERYVPRLIRWGEKAQDPVSLVLIGCTLLAVFGKYSAFFFRQPGQIFIAVSMAWHFSSQPST